MNNSASSNGKLLLLVDGSSYLYRAFHAALSEATRFVNDDKARAAELYLAAYKTEPSPIRLWSLARSEHLSGDVERALHLGLHVEQGHAWSEAAAYQRPLPAAQATPAKDQSERELIYRALLELRGEIAADNYDVLLRVGQKIKISAEA